MSGIVTVIQSVSFGVRTSVSFEREHRYHLADIINKRTIKTDDKRTIIIEYIHRNGEVKTEDLVKLLSSSTTRIKMLLYQLVDEGILVSCGGNRNRTYKLKEQEQS